MVASWLQASCGCCPAFRINLGPISVESQLSCAVLIHNFLLHLARRQETHSLSTRLKGKKRGWRITKEGRALLLFFSLLSRVWLFVGPWTVAGQAPLSIGFLRQEYWSGLPFPSPGKSLYPGIKPVSTVSPALAGGFLTPSTTWQAQYHRKYVLITITPLLYPCVSKTID